MMENILTDFDWGLIEVLVLVLLSSLAVIFRNKKKEYFLTVFKISLSIFVLSIFFNLINLVQIGDLMSGFSLIGFLFSILPLFWLEKAD